MKTTIRKIKPTGFELTFKAGCEDVIHADGITRGSCTPRSITVFSMRQATRLATSFMARGVDRKIELRPLFGPVA